MTLKYNSNKWDERVMGNFLRSTKEPDQIPMEAKREAKIADASPEIGQRSDSLAQMRSGPSIIGAGLKVTGNLETDNELQIEGRVEGDITGKVVTIKEGSEVIGSIRCETVNIAGKTQGQIEARRVVVSKTAHTTGDIIHDSLQIDAGAYVDGHCRPGFGKGDARPKPVETLPQPALKVAPNAAE